MVRTLKLCLLYMISPHIFHRILLYSQHIADPHIQETVLSLLQFSQSKQQSSIAGFSQSLFVSCPSSLEPGISRATDSPSPSLSL